MKISVRKNRDDSIDGTWDIYVDRKKSDSYILILNRGRWIGVWLHNTKTHGSVELGVFDCGLVKRPPDEEDSCNA